MSTIQGTGLNTVNWQGLLDKLVETSGVDGAAKISTDNHTLVFKAEVNGATTTITVNIPDDLPLPGEVDEEAITSLINKLSGANPGLTADEIQALKEQLTTLYNEMAGALDEIVKTSTGNVMFDLYRLMALLVDVAQSQRDAARELRTAQSAQIQNSIQSQADMQRSAAMVGLIVGVVCGVASVVVSCVMVGLQSAAYKNQVSAARASGTDVAQTNAKMINGADTPEHANAQLQKVEGQVGENTARTVKGEMDNKLTAPKARADQAEALLAEKQGQLDRAQVELNDMKAGGVKDPQAIEQAKTARDQARAAAEIPEGKTASKAKFDYVRECATNRVPTDPQKMAKFDTAIQAEAKYEALNKAPTADQLSAKELEVTNLRAARNDAKAAYDTAHTEYRLTVKETVQSYARKYQSAVAAEGSNSKAATQARNEMRMAQAYGGSKLAEEGVTTVAEYHADVVEATDAVDKANQRLNGDADYRQALHNIERYTGINAINTALGNMFQGMTQNISGMMSAEATRLGSEQEQERDQLDQTKDLFDQAQGLVDAVVQLMQAVASAESQSMRDAIQA